MDNGKVVIAELRRARGNRGEILARSQTDVPGRLENLRDAHVQLADGSDVPVIVERAWRHKDDWVLKFAGVDSIDAAERFRGADLWVPKEQRATLADGEFFQTDLIGCRVVDAHTGEPVGVVEGWQQYGGPPLMELNAGGREVLVPFVPALCRKVDLTAKMVTMELPEGLLDL